MSPIRPSTSEIDKENVRILKDSIEELRIMFQHISSIYDQTRNKTLALIAGEVAILTLIFSGNYSFPTQYYLLIFFFLGCGLLVAAFILFLWQISSINWEVPYDARSSSELVAEFDSELSLLTRLHNDYNEAIKHNMAVIKSKTSRMNLPIYCLIFGVTIILIVKFGG